MKSKITLCILLAALCATAQTYDTNNVVVQTFAGSGFSGYVDGVGQLTMFNYPSLIVADSHSNLFVWDFQNYRIRKIAPDSTVSTFAGGGSQTTGVGTNVYFNYVTAMTIDRSDTIWIVSSSMLYKITSGASITLTDLSFSLSGICADSQGNIYISGGGDQKIYRYSTNGVLSVFAGSGNGGYADGNGIFTAFYSPAALATDAANNIYVWDSGNSLIRRIDQSQNVTTLAGRYQDNQNADGVGTNATFNSIYQMCFDNSGNLILACGNSPSGGDSIRKMNATTKVVTMAGRNGPQNSDQ